MNITIRPAAERDIPKLLELLTDICRLHQQGRPDLFRQGGTKYDAEALKAILAAPKRAVLVAADEADAVCGYVFGIYQVHRGETGLNDLTTLYVDDLCVDKRCRGQGIGKMLYDAAAELARETGCYNMTLHVWAFNEDAMRFYQRCGMKVQETCMETIL